MKWGNQTAKDAQVARKRVTGGGGGLKQLLPSLQTRTHKRIARTLAQQEDFLSTPTYVTYVLKVFTKTNHQHIIWTERRRAKIVQTVIGHLGHPTRASLVSQVAHQDSMQILATTTSVPLVLWDFFRKKKIKHYATHATRLMMRTKMWRAPPAARLARTDGLVEPLNKARPRAASHAQLVPS